jgi:hypothetical protein
MIYIIQKDHHDRKYKKIGHKANNEYEVNIEALQHPVGNAHLSLSKGRNTP